MAQRTTAQSSWCPLVLGESTRAQTQVSPSAEVSCPAVAGRSQQDDGLKHDGPWAELMCAIQSNSALVETL